MNISCTFYWITIGAIVFFFFHRGVGLGNVYNSPDVKAGSSLSHADLLIPRSHTSSAVFYPMVLSSIVSRSHGVYGKLLEMQSLGWCLTRCAWGCLWGVRMGVYSFSTLSVTKPSSNLVLVQPLEGRGDSWGIIFSSLQSLPATCLLPYHKPCPGAWLLHLHHLARTQSEDLRSKLVVLG